MVRKADMPIQKLTPEIITAAILGFEEQKRHIDSQISELKAMLAGVYKILRSGGARLVCRMSCEQRPV
jgi:hypothetical protein